MSLLKCIIYSKRILRRSRTNDGVDGGLNKIYIIMLLHIKSIIVIISPRVASIGENQP